MKRVFTIFLRKHLLQLIGLIVILLILLAVSLLPAQITKYLLDNFFKSANPTFQSILLICFIYIGIYVLQETAQFIKQIILIHIGESITKELRLEMAKKLERINHEYLSNLAPGATTSLFVNDVTLVNSLFTEDIIGMVFDLAKIIGIVVMMFLFKVALGIFSLVSLPFIILLTYYFRKRTLKSLLKSREDLANISNHITETSNNIEMIQLYKAGPFMESKFEDLLNQHFNDMRRSNFYDSIYSPLVKVFSSILIFLILLIGEFNPEVIGLTIGLLGASIQYISDLFNPVNNLGMELQSLQKVTSGVKRIQAFFKEKNRDYSKEQSLISVDMLNRNIYSKEDMIVFNNCSFQYDNSKAVLEDISISIQKDIPLCVMGRTGGGKSTFLHLLMGSFKPTKGEVNICGVPSFFIPDEEKYKLFGYVAQDYHVVQGTIYDNICFANHQISKETVLSTLKLVGMYEVVNNYKNGLDTNFSQTSFSEGELQLLSIARAIVWNPPILIIDEMSSHLDSKTELLVIETIKRVSKSRTCIHVTHRFTDFLLTSKIAILEDNKISFVGSFKDALDTNEWFKDSYTLQKNAWK